MRHRGERDSAFTFDRREQAEAFLAQDNARRAQRGAPDPALAQRTLLATLVARYIQTECPRHKGGAAEAARLNKLLRDAGNATVPYAGAAAARGSRRQAPKGRVAAHVQWLNRPLADLTAEDLEDYIAERLECVRPATVDREIDLIVAVVRVATTTWRHALAHDPLRGLRRPRYFNERSRRLHAGEEELLLARAAECQHPGVGVVIRLALETAMRRSELLAFRWADVDWPRRCIVLRDTKNGRAHRPPLTKVAIDILQSLARGEGSALAITEEGFKSAWQRLLARGRERVLRADPASPLLDDLRFHDLRHEALSRLAESGAIASAMDLQAISGHRDPRMLLRYLTLSTAKLAERMDAARAAPPPTYVHRGRTRIGRPLPGCAQTKPEPTPPRCSISSTPTPLATAVILSLDAARSGRRRLRDSLRS